MLSVVAASGSSPSPGTLVLRRDSATWKSPWIEMVPGSPMRAAAAAASVAGYAGSWPAATPAKAGSTAQERRRARDRLRLLMTGRSAVGVPAQSALDHSSRPDDQAARSPQA